MADPQPPYRVDRSVLTITTLGDEPNDTRFWLTKSAAERLAALEFMRQRRGMTITAIPRALGYATHSHISEIEHGKRAIAEISR